MIKVNNKESIHTLTKRFLKVNKNRNCIAILAIILTSVLFTTVFTASLSMIKSTMESSMRIIMVTSHVAAQNLTKEQYDRISKDNEIKKQGLNIYLTMADNNELKNIQTEIRYAEKIATESYQCVPKEGSLPNNQDEIATSTIVLKALGVQPKLGEKVKLLFTVSGQKISKEFTLSGYWDGDTVAMAQMVWISKSYCDRVAPIATEEGILKGNYEGAYNIAIWFSNPYNLEKKAYDLESRYDLQDTNADVQANPAYNIFTTESFPFGAVAILLAIIVLSGYLIIYNVFNISVNMDIRIYGLLMNIGTTGKQLKKIVKLQALWLSVIGIPIGMVLGFLIGSKMTPYLLSDISNSSKTTLHASVAFHPIIFIAAALFSLITIYIGCYRPCRVVGRLTPIEAVRMTDVKSNKKIKKNRNLSTIYMALSNIKRTWGKGFILIISLALSLLVLNAVYMIVRGFDFDRYTSMLISADLEISKVSSNEGLTELDNITPEFKKKVYGNKDIASVGYIYYTKTTQKIDDKTYQKIADMIKKSQDDVYNKQQKKVIQNYLDKREVPCRYIGINEAAFNRLNFKEGNCSWTDFCSGKYVISEINVYSYTLVPGDKVQLKFNNENSKDYHVIAIANLPVTFIPKHDGPFYISYLIPEKEYINKTSNDKAILAAIDVKKGKLHKVSDWINDYMKSNDYNCAINSRYELHKQFQSFVNKYYAIGALLIVVLFVIGILNYSNTMMTSILSRRKELTLLEVVGMTKKQILKMLVWEGGIYLVLAWIFSTLASILCAQRLISMVVGPAFFFKCKISVLPSIAVLPFLFLVIIIIAISNYRRICKETVIERIRNE